jgi:lysophospholipase L1-like esterase
VSIKRIIESVTAMLEAEKRIRVLAFGSSNTQRRSCGMHWLDCLELGLNRSYGPYATVINAGRGGDTAEMLLERFDEDAAFYKPHLAIVTIGGNDSVGGKTVKPEQFIGNLKTIYGKFTDLGAKVIFQTYYAFNRKAIGEEAWKRFNEFMRIVRGIAIETRSGLIDNLERWTLLQEQEPAIFDSLMLDPWHLNGKGNLVMGYYLARIFGTEGAIRGNDSVDEAHFFDEAARINEMMDKSV